MAAPGSVLIAQLTDTHVLAGSSDLDNDERLAAVIDVLAAERPVPAVVLLTGDLADDHQPAQYVALAALLEPLDIAVLALPGNHDDRESVRRTFPDTPWIDADHASWVTSVGGVRIIGLDSTRPGRHSGEFDSDRADWLGSELARRHDGPTVLAMHHPPFATGIDWMDRPEFLGADRFAEVVAATPGTVDRIVCGHLHRPMTASVGGVAAQVGLSTARHVALDLADDAGVSLVDEPIGYQLHLVTGRTIVTHTRYVGAGGEPFVPDWAESF